MWRHFPMVVVLKSSKGIMNSGDPKFNDEVDKIYVFVSSSLERRFGNSFGEEISPFLGSP